MRTARLSGHICHGSVLVPIDSGRLNIEAQSCQVNNEESTPTFNSRHMFLRTVAISRRLQASVSGHPAFPTRFPSTLSMAIVIDHLHREKLKG